MGIKKRKQAPFKREVVVWMYNDALLKTLEDQGLTFKHDAMLKNAEFAPHYGKRNEANHMLVLTFEETIEEE